MSLVESRLSRGEARLRLGSASSSSGLSLASASASGLSLWPVLVLVRYGIGQSKSEGRRLSGTSVPDRAEAAAEARSGTRPRLDQYLVSARSVLGPGLGPPASALS